MQSIPRRARDVGRVPAAARGAASKKCRDGRRYHDFARRDALDLLGER